jgi:glutaredoxin
MESRRIIVYSQPFWGPCAALAEYLTSKGVTFERKDLMIDEEAREELFSLGVRSAPALVVDGEVMTGFDKARIDALLGLWSRLRLLVRVRFFYFVSFACLFNAQPVYLWFSFACPVEFGFADLFNWDGSLFSFIYTAFKYLCFLSFKL